MCSWTEEGLTPRIGRSLCSLILCPGAMVEILRIRGSFRPGAAVSSETSLQGFITAQETCIKTVNMTGEIKECSQSVK